MQEDIFHNCGQEFHRVDKSKWVAIKKNRAYEGIALDSSILTEDIDYKIEFSEKHVGFVCGLIKVKIANKDMWLPMLFFDVSGQWQRVHLENSFCTNCNWKGIIANPTDPDLYLALPERFELMRKSAELKRATCPVCQGEIARFAIWAEK
ncbi:hypothetical protein LI951_02940 [Enterococcus sp. BWT-B8]|uniref:hypothetical protein n=1 Tax=Enterococcus sp. BWT-B8 TaxID=2885157 RepID=UPI001E3E13F9|nr:hypothetical protein [Enterococcus sp. BWT-B8]MCB5951016.1 hypothetical protein [Enterococcus sp. BWT-B8]